MDEGGVFGSTSSDLREHGIEPVYDDDRFVRGWYGIRKRARFLTLFEWCLFIGASVLILATGGITIARICEVQTAEDKPLRYSDEAFGGVLLVNLGFTAYYLVHGIWSERVWEMVACSAMAIIVVLYTVVNYALSPHNCSWSGVLNVYKIVRLESVIVLGLPAALCSGYLAWNYNCKKRLIYFSLRSASPDLQKACERRYMCQDLFLFCAQLALSILIMLFAVEDPRLVLGTVSAISTIYVGVVWILLGFYSLRSENATIAKFFVALSIMPVGFVLYLFIKAALLPSASDKSQLLVEICIVAIVYCCVVGMTSYNLIWKIARHDFKLGLSARLSQNCGNEPSLDNIPPHATIPGLQVSLDTLRSQPDSEQGDTVDSVAETSSQKELIVEK